MTHHWADDQYVTSRAMNAALPRGALKTIREPRESTTAVSPDGDLRMTLPPGLWNITISIVMARPDSASAPGIRTKWFWPQGVSPSTPRWCRGTTSSASDPTSTLMRLAVHSLSTVVTYGSEIFTSQPFTGLMEQAVVDLADGGEIGLAWAQHTANATANYVMAGSFITGEPLEIY